MSRGGYGAGAAATAPDAFALGEDGVHAFGDRHNGDTAGTRKRLVRCIRHDGGPSFVAMGQQARALVALAKAGATGVTAQELASWAYRLAAYCWELRRKGLDIETRRETHPGGWHGRHVLHTPVTVEALGGSDDAR
jgi:hypothetical protein